MAGGPILMTVAGDRFVKPARILMIIWEGSTSAGDTAEIKDPETNQLLWPGRANDTNTYLGGNFGAEGIHCPNGFALTKISAGRVLVYLREN